MANKQRYLALTIGPIYKTLNKAEKTRELWAGSYLFSWICRRLLETMKSTGSYPVADTQILLPNPAALTLFGNGQKPGVGMFVDRIMIVAGDNQDLNWLENQIIAPVKKELAAVIIDGIEKYKGFDPYANLFQTEVLLKHKKNIRNESVTDFITNYFQIYSLEAIADQHLIFEEKDPETGAIKALGVVKSLNLLLDHLELRTSLAHFDPDPIKVFMRGVNHSKLRSDVMLRDRFDSLPEIATVELRYVADKKFKTDYDELVEKHLNEAKRKQRVATQQEKYGLALPEDVDESNLHEAL